MDHQIVADLKAMLALATDLKTRENRFNALIAMRALLSKMPDLPQDLKDLMENLNAACPEALEQQEKNPSEQLVRSANAAARATAHRMQEIKEDVQAKLDELENANRMQVEQPEKKE